MDTNVVQQCTEHHIHERVFIRTDRHKERGKAGITTWPLQSEPFAEIIRRDPDVKGITVRENSGKPVEIKLGAFADDTQGYVSDMNSIDKWFIHLDTYSRASGAVINKDKTKGTLLGPLKGTRNKPIFIKWTEGPLNVLGVIRE